MTLIVVMKAEYLDVNIFHIIFVMQDLYNKN
jgi:hypothetical protein